MRLDQFLIKHFKIESRTKAQELIEAGSVFHTGLNKALTKPSYDVNDQNQNFIQIKDYSQVEYVSRAGTKLKNALTEAKIDVQNKVALDVGQSTGGFTDCLLQNGASKVVGIDVGTDQVHPKIKSDSRAVCIEKLNVKEAEKSEKLNSEMPKNGFDLIVGDVSFISLKQVIPHVKSFLKKDGEYLFLVKPQFECGPENLNKNGIVKSEKILLDIEQEIKQNFKEHFGSVTSYFESSIQGKEGNREFFIYGKKIN